MRRDSLRRLAPGVIVALAVGLILLTAGTGVMVTRHLQQDALNISRLYSGVFARITKACRTERQDLPETTSSRR